MKSIFLFIFFIFNYFSPLNAEEQQKVFLEALNSWKDGRIEDAIESYKYLLYVSTNEKDQIEYTKDLSVLLNNLGRPATAKIYIDKVEAAGFEDPFLKYEKGMALYAMKKFTEAKKAFEEVPLLSNREDLIYNARFMSSMTEMELGGPLKAVEGFQTVYQKYPYLLAPSAYMIADCYEQAKKRNISVNFLKEALLYDSMNIQALIKLANIYDETSYYLPAWQSYYTLSEIDPENSFFIKAKKRLLKYAAREKKPDNLLYWVRLAWPVHDSKVSISKGEKISVGLFSNNFTQYETQGFDFISNSNFNIFDSKLGKTYSGRKKSQYSVRYLEKDRLFELKDNSGSRVYTTRQNFSIKPVDENEVILLKTPIFKQESPLINKSDRELTGSLEIHVSTTGMKIVNKTWTEHVQAGIISRMSIPKDNSEFLKALSLVIRTSIKNYLKSPVSTQYDICDSKDCYEYIGLQFENSYVVKAMKETYGESLLGPSNITFHKACGGKTLSEVDDRANRQLRYTPSGVEIYFMTQPDRDLYCLPEDSTLFSEVLWTVILEPKWIEERINPKYHIGSLKNINIIKRDSQMRPISIRINGSASDAIVEGRKSVNWALSGGNFRSEKFTIRPIMKGDRASYFIVRGIGTGNMEGFCLSGAYGLAKHHGYSYKKIISHYFPSAKIFKFKNELYPKKQTYKKK